MIDLFNRYGGMIFIYVIGIIFTILMAYEIAIGQQPSSYALWYVGLAVIQATHSSGVQQGVNNTNDTVKKVAAAQYPLVADKMVNTDVH